MTLLNELRAELHSIEYSQKKYREFAIVVAVFMALLSFWLRFSTWEMVIFGGAWLIIVSYVEPASLRLPYGFWMGIAITLGFISSRILFTAIYIIVVSPIAIIARLAGRDVLGIRNLGEQKSYWVAYQQSGTIKERFERLF